VGPSDASVVIIEVCEAFEISEEELKQKDRLQNNCMARSAACALLEEMGYTQTKIAEMLGRDRTNVWRQINVSHYKYLKKPLYARRYRLMVSQLRT
jgi:chromosomal replication initiation ATPase DnaA